jgi:hypothetical protein
VSDRRRILDHEPYAHFVTFSRHRRRQALEVDQPQRGLLASSGHRFQQENVRK